VAHIGYFREAYVVQRRWLSEQEFAELVAIANLLPGPSSSQLGIAIGSRRAGRPGGLAAWVGFTLPSAVAMTALALAVASTDVAGAGWVHGLELVAVPVVALAVLAMRRSLAPDVPRLVLAVAGAVIALAWSGFGGQAAAIVLGAAVGAVVLRRLGRPPALSERYRGRGVAALACLVAFAALLFGVPALLDPRDEGTLALFDAMFRSGALVFGGGHVVLPLLHDAVVAPGWVGEQEFLAGYGLVQAMPGPLFTFSAYLGAVRDPEPTGIAGAAIALGAIFLPSFLLLGGVLPLWSSIRRHAVVQAALAGVGAAVVGVLAAALWNPVLTTSIDGVGDVVFAACLLVLLRVLPVWAVVPLAAALGAVVF
jgi:chromate transporter